MVLVVSWSTTFNTKCLLKSSLVGGKAVPANIHVICQKNSATSVFEPKKYAKRRQIRNTHKWFETGLKQWEALDFHTLLFIPTFLYSWMHEIMQKVRKLLRMCIHFRGDFWKNHNTRKKILRRPVATVETNSMSACKKKDLRLKVKV